MKASTGHSHCDTSHEQCRAASASPLPTRVLDLGDDQTRSIRLHLGHDEIERYTCLSHFWGRKPLLRTIASNLTAHTNSISWNSLPLTFQEGIIFTRKLNIRYLWVDSLFIVQDDDEDWRREGAKMATVCANAQLTMLFSTLKPQFKTHQLEVASSSSALNRSVRA